jgi:cytidyltransferase-related domain
MTPSETFGLGIVIGKFLPPHRGHRFLIETAISRCQRTVVIICGKPSDPIPGEIRAAWLREMIPRAEIMLIDDRYDENDSKIWAENTIRWLGRAPDVVFTSEDYGNTYASHMGCKHVMVDHARLTIPCSGTAVRNDPMTMWDFIDPPVRGWFAKRVVILGAESTGTTTLAMDLASALGTCWVPEYGREYSLIKQAACDANWHTDEFAVIAREQNRLENEAARTCNRILVCDTDSFATTLWHRRYMGYDSEQVREIATERKADLYLLTGDEIPFVQDGLRDGEHIRHEMHRWFVDALEGQSLPWHLIEGSREERVTVALEALGSFRHGK